MEMDMHECQSDILFPLSIALFTRHGVPFSVKQTDVVIHLNAREWNGMNSAMINFFFHEFHIIYIIEAKTYHI